MKTSHYINYTYYTLLVIFHYFLCRYFRSMIFNFYKLRIIFRNRQNLANHIFILVKHIQSVPKLSDVFSLTDSIEHSDENSYTNTWDYNKWETF